MAANDRLRGLFRQGSGAATDARQMQFKPFLNMVGKGLKRGTPVPCGDDIHQFDVIAQRLGDICDSPPPP